MHTSAHSYTSAHAMIGSYYPRDGAPHVASSDDLRHAAMSGIVEALAAALSGIVEALAAAMSDIVAALAEAMPGCFVEDLAVAMTGSHSENNEGPSASLPAGFRIIWHCPTLEGPCGPTTIGAGGLNCRVRDGNGWNPAAIGARNLIPPRPRAGAPGDRVGKLHREEPSSANLETFA